MGGLFSKCFGASNTEEEAKKETKAQSTLISEKDKTLLKLKDLRDDIHIKTKQIEQQLTKSENEIKNLLIKKKKELAIFALKRKKLYEDYMDTMQNKQLFITRAISEVEKAMMDSKLAGVMKDANDILKEVQVALSVDTIQEYMENVKDVENQRKQMNQFFEAHNVHDADVESQYNKIEADLVKEQFKQAEFKPIIPISSYGKQPENIAIQQIEPEIQAKKNKEKMDLKLAELA